MLSFMEIYFLHILEQYTVFQPFNANKSFSHKVKNELSQLFSV